MVYRVALLPQSLGILMRGIYLKMNEEMSLENGKKKQHFVQENPRFFERKSPGLELTEDWGWRHLFQQCVQ